MSLNLVMRVTYLLGWASAIVALLYRALQILGIEAVKHLPLGSRGILFFGGFMFVATIATAAYAQAQPASGNKPRGAAA